MHSLILALLLILGQAVTPPSLADDLTTVHNHYVNAAYDEALVHLTTLEPEDVTAELEKYRALCLLALGRTEDGERSFERLVRIAPLYRIPEGDVAPRLFAVFQQIRRRTLPLVVRELYADGKAAYENKQYPRAVADLGNLLRILREPDAVADPSALADLGQLAAGFLQLAQAEIAMQERVAAARPPPAPPPPPVVEPVVEAVSAAQAPVTRVGVYSGDDRQVRPPVELERFMPPWDPPAVMARFLEYRGELELVVDETGRVREAVMLRPTIPSYDVALIAATERWRFAPARLAGEPVKYRLRFEIVLSPNR